MSALGQKQTFAPQKVVSAYPRKRLGMSAIGHKPNSGDSNQCPRLGDERPWRCRISCFPQTRSRCGTLRGAMSCGAVFIVSSFQLGPFCFYLLMFFLLTQMRSLNSVGGCKTLNSVRGWKNFSKWRPLFLRCPNSPPRTARERIGTDVAEPRQPRVHSYSAQPKERARHLA
jgi:hypothetical protein